MSSRRKFLKRSATGLVSTAIAPVAILEGQDAPDMVTVRSELEKGEWEIVRELFPLSPDRAYLNTGTMGPMSHNVLDTLGEWNTKVATSGEYGGYEPALARIAEFVGANKDEIAITHNTTEGINIVAQGIRLKSGDEVILTDNEHVGGALPWLARAKKDGIVLKTFTPSRRAAQNLELISELITTRTRVIAVPHILCTTGIRLPIKEIAVLAKERGIVSVVDGAHGPGSMELKLAELGVHVYVSCCHKWLCGPSGTGFIYVADDIQERIEPVFVGAMSDSGWQLNTDHQSITGWNPTAHRYFYGTQSASLAQGVIAAMDLMEELGVTKIEERILQLSKYLTQALLKADLPIELLSAEEEGSRSGMVGFRHLKIDYQSIFKQASEARFRVRVVPESGLDSVRISTHIFNSEKEIDGFVDFLRTLE